MSLCDSPPEAQARLPQATATATMPATQEQIDQLKQHLSTGADEATVQLKQLQGKLGELNESASSYFQSGIEKANESVAALTDLGNNIKDDAGVASEEWAKSAQNALADLNKSLGELKQKAAEYDESSKSQLSEGVAAAKATFESLVSSTQEATSSALASFSSALASFQESASEHAKELGENVKETADVATAKAQETDTDYGISAAVASGVAAVSGALHTLGEKLHLTSEAKP